MPENFLIAPFSEGLDQELAPWLLPQDAFVRMNDAFVSRGVLQKRFGYKELATGGEGAAPVTQSRIQDSVGAFPGLPVMGLPIYIDSNSNRKLCAIDTRNFNVYNTTTNTLDFVTPKGTAFSGTISDFWHSTNYSVLLTTPSNVFKRILVFTNGVDLPKYYDGTKTDDLNAHPNYTQPPAEIGGNLEKCKLVFYFGDRLCCLNTTQSGVDYPQRMLYSGTVGSATSLDFSDVRAGVIDAPTDDEIMGADFIAGSLIVFFKTGVWAIKVTQDQFFPFRWERIDVKGIARCDARFSVSSYYGEVTAAGKLGIIGTDSNSVARVDNKLPFFMRDQVDPELFHYSYAIESERKRQRWLTYADKVNSTSSANKILVNGMEDNTWSIYNLPIHTLGNFHETEFDDLWDEFTDDWDTYGEPWDSYASFKDALTIVGGDVDGYVLQMDTEDNDGKTTITGISKASPAVVTVANHRLVTGDKVKVYDVAGMTEINGLQSFVTVLNTTSFQLNDINSTDFTAYTSGGEVEKGIAFDVKTKPLNPWIKEDRKAVLHWVDFRVDSSENTTCEVQFFTDEREAAYRLIDQGISGEFYNDEAYGATDPGGDATFYIENSPILQGTVSIDLGGGAETITDDNYGNLTGSVAATGRVDYKNGFVTITGGVASSDILVDYERDNTSLVLNFNDDSGRPVKWIRVYVNSTAFSHQIRMFQQNVDERLRIHAIRLAMSPGGTVESP